MVLVDAVRLDLGVVEQVEEGGGGDDDLQVGRQAGPLRVHVLVQPAPVACGGVMATSWEAEIDRGGGGLAASLPSGGGICDLSVIQTVL